MRFERILDSAIATDGGSLGLTLERADGGRAALTLDQSIDSRGGPNYGRVSLDGSRLSSAVSAEVLREIQRLQGALSAADQAKHMVSRFVTALREQSAAS